MPPFRFADYIEAEQAEARAAAAGNREVADALDNVLEAMTVRAERFGGFFCVSTLRSINTYSVCANERVRDVLIAVSEPRPRFATGSKDRLI
jgi:hypothetical protein